MKIKAKMINEAPARLVFPGFLEFDNLLFPTYNIAYSIYSKLRAGLVLNIQ